MPFSPLEQFIVNPKYLIIIDGLFFSLTSFNIYNILAVFIFILFYYFLLNNSVIHTKYFWVVKDVFYFFDNMTFQILGKESSKYFSLLFTVFWFIALNNVIGLVPLTQAITFHFIITLGLALFLFLGTTTKGLVLYGLEFFYVFLHWGTSKELAPVLASIELISYIFRPLSLAIRLFANIMAGHILMKILLGFLSIFFSASMAIMVIPEFTLFVIISLLFLLEILISLLQAYIFTLLTCMYINDASNM